MASSKNICKNMLDSEVEDTISRKRGVSPNLSEKPLSPVLSGSLNNRKFLIGRRLNHKKSRIKLSNRFNENEGGMKVVNPINVSIPMSLDDSMSTSQTNSLTDHLDKLEALENSRNNIYKVLVGNTKSEFVIPKSVDKLKIGEVKSVQIRDTSEVMKSTFNSQQSVPHEIISNEASIGFKTAAGKNVSVPETEIKKYSKLFEDIIHPTQSEGRQNKHAFLTKINVKHKNTESSTSKTDLNTCNINRSYPKNLVHSNTLKDYSVSFNSNSKVSDYLIAKGKNIFADEDLSDIKFNGDNFCGFKKVSMPTFCSTDTSTMFNTGKNTDISFTQAICDSGISNTQILNAFEDILNTSDNDQSDHFRGFTDYDIKESQNKLLCMEKCVESIHFEFSKKRKRSIHSTNEYDNHNAEEFKNVADTSPMKKKKRVYDKLSDKINKENGYLQTSETLVGFKSASGKLIAISEKCMKNAETIFHEMNDDFPQLKTSKYCNLLEQNKNSKIKTVACETSEKSLVMPKSNKKNLAEISNASKSFIKIPEKSVLQAKNLFSEEDFGDINFNSDKFCGFKKASTAHPTYGRTTKINSVSCETSEKPIVIPKSNKKNLTALSNASKSFIKIPEKSVLQAKNIFSEEDFGDINFNNDNFCGFKKASTAHPTYGRTTKINSVSCETSEKPLVMSKNNKKNLAEISNASNSLIPEKSILLAKNIFSEEDFGDIKFNNDNFCGFKKASIAHPTRSRTNNSKKIDTERETFIEPITEYCAEDTESENDDYKHFSTAHIPHTSSNKLIQENNPMVGFSKASGQPVNISKTSFDKAKSVFDNLETDYSYQDDDKTIVAQTSTSSVIADVKLDLSDKKSFSEKDMSIKTTPVILHKSKSFGLSTKNSKKKLGMSHFKPIPICNDKLKKAKLLFEDDQLGVSPIKPRQTATYTSTPIRGSDNSVSKDHRIMPKNSFSNFMDAAGITPIKMNVIETKELDVTSTNDTKIVFTSPTKSNWLNDLETERKKLELRLQVLVAREELGQLVVCQLAMGKSEEDKMPRKGFLNKMKTATKRVSLVDFVENKTPGNNITNIELRINPKNAENAHFIKQSVPFVETKDGATVIPNFRDMVGLSEIKTAFEAMPGVEPRLIPNEWIRNHYKWIVWKLASYENQFPSYFTECLNIENVVQQLKYRYDREIDKAERSALRKIFEKDDAPQKRMVLCVSDIKMVVARKYELELTDGWYAIRTIIDEPLCKQVISGKIKIGTKLAISGAELLNCDGCHPLEATDMACLKINCNSTRRAIWYAKLGFQRNSNPFPIQLQSIYPLGGPIAAVKVCVVRVYPFKYMEKLEGGSIWRNKKSEEIAAQKWENERFKKMEQIQHELSKKYESSYNESMSLTSFNKDSFQDLSKKKQAEIAAEVSASVSNMKLDQRDVVAVLKLLVIDAIGSLDKPFSFFIWRPTEAHVQSLREGKSFTVLNVLPRPNGDLNSTSKTTFKSLETANNCRCTKYKRRLVKISELVQSKFSPHFNEFDTVGIVVQIKIESHSQEVWITDNSGRLLLITVNEGPSTCSLLDSLKRGQPTTICNLIFNGVKKDVVHATANHFTVFSLYSQYRHLQEGLEEFKNEIVVDVPNLLNDCDSKIEVFRIISDINSFSANFEMTDEETLVTLDQG